MNGQIRATRPSGRISDIILTDGEGHYVADVQGGAIQWTDNPARAWVFRDEKEAMAAVPPGSAIRPCWHDVTDDYEGYLEADDE